MKVLTIQSENIDINKRVYADPSKCNHLNALPVYKRLFSDYNSKHSTTYSSFFWGFSKLLTNDLNQAVKRACEMIGQDLTEGKVLILDIPRNLCLETDFYNFSDEIYSFEYPNELDSCWESIYEKRNSERQVIFPYIDTEMILYSFDLSRNELFLSSKKESLNKAIQDCKKLRDKINDCQSENMKVFNKDER